MSGAATGFRKCKAEGRCRLCGQKVQPRPNDPVPYLGPNERVFVMTKHHLIPQRLFRFDVKKRFQHDPRNVVPLCRRCHNEVEHAHPVRRRLFRARLRVALLPDEIAFLASVMGRPWLDREYPLADDDIDAMLGLSVRAASSQSSAEGSR